MPVTEAQPEAAVRMYHARAETYEDSWHPEYSERFMTLVPVRPGDAVLSLCCGTGLDAFMAAERVGEAGRVVGVDISPAMLGKARERKEKDTRLGPRISLFLHGVTDLDDWDEPEVRKGSFDVILCSNAFVLLDDPIAVARQWKQYLKPGGRVAIDIPHENNLRSGIIMERVAVRLGVAFPANRSWITSQDSLSQVLEREGYVMENIAEVEKIPGQRSTYYTLADADSQYDYLAKQTLTTRVFDDNCFKERAPEVFREEWARDAVDGRIEVVDTLYVYIARKPE